jgi:hypothetical protein
MATAADIKKSFSNARILGAGDDRVTLTESELYCLLAQCWRDLGVPQSVFKLPPLPIPPPSTDYYRIPLSWFQTPQPKYPSASALLESLASCVIREADFRLYFENLTALHKRRLKYQRILAAQPRPTMNQVGPRSLLEFGAVDDALLAAWLIWRKWIFDVDNRAAQETGYLFEPVLASCLGGEAVGSRNSPVKRVNDGGQRTDDGRQIDCYDGENQLAYEFKLRVTIAASGQGRFAEELSFPVECRAAGLTPVLIVLDPTPSARLAELIRAFEANNGRYYVGPDAWAHMEEKAGQTMAVFLERYIKPPLTEMTKHEDALPQALEISWTAETITVKGAKAILRIPRRQPPPG